MKKIFLCLLIGSSIIHNLSCMNEMQTRNEMLWEKRVIAIESHFPNNEEQIKYLFRKYPTDDLNYKKVQKQVQEIFSLVHLVKLPYAQKAVAEIAQTTLDVFENFIDQNSNNKKFILLAIHSELTKHFYLKSYKIPSILKKDIKFNNKHSVIHKAKKAYSDTCNSDILKHCPLFLAKSLINTILKLNINYTVHLQTHKEKRKARS